MSNHYLLNEKIWRVKRNDNYKKICYTSLPTVQPHKILFYFFLKKKNPKFIFPRSRIKIFLKLSKFSKSLKTQPINTLNFFLRNRNEPIWQRRRRGRGSRVKKSLWWCGWLSFWWTDCLLEKRFGRRGW